MTQFLEKEKKWHSTSKKKQIINGTILIKIKQNTVHRKKGTVLRKKAPYLEKEEEKKNPQ